MMAMTTNSSINVKAPFCSGFFTVGPQERAIVLRFGKPVGGDLREGARVITEEEKPARK